MLLHEATGALQQRVCRPQHAVSSTDASNIVRSQVVFRAPAAHFQIAVAVLCGAQHKSPVFVAQAQIEMVG